MVEAEEFRKIRPLWVWTGIVVLSVSLVGWGLLNYALIEDRQREWDFGQLPDTPAESVYSSRVPTQPANAPTQVPRLPGATTLPADTPQERQP